MAGHQAAEAGHAEAAFPSLLHLAVAPDYFRVDDGEGLHPRGIRIAGPRLGGHDEKPHGATHLGRGDSDLTDKNVNQAGGLSNQNTSIDPNKKF